MPEGSISDVTQERHSAEFGGTCVIDIEVIETLRDMAGDDEPEFLLEVIELFLEDSEERMADMGEAARRGDTESVARTAHALRSASMSVGANTLAQSCGDVESAIRSGLGLDLRAKADRLAGMFTEVQRVLRTLRTCVQARME